MKSIINMLLFIIQVIINKNKYNNNNNNICMIGIAKHLLNIIITIT